MTNPSSAAAACMQRTICRSESISVPSQSKMQSLGMGATEIIKDCLKIGLKGAVNLDRRGRTTHPDLEVAGMQEKSRQAE
ncbi:MAG: hypothetical protein K0S46_571 [Moraxellaceae bacterium]|nr:hypothetical protein [Moraxellaceae bacterium]